MTARSLCTFDLAERLAPSLRLLDHHGSLYSHVLSKVPARSLHALYLSLRLTPRTRSIRQGGSLPYFAQSDNTARSKGLRYPQIRLTHLVYSIQVPVRSHYPPYLSTWLTQHLRTILWTGSLFCYAQSRSTANSFAPASALRKSSRRPKASSRLSNPLLSSL